ncbi:MAG: DUF4872 domain-containing protein, partial [Anaerolineales bacterium]
HPKARLSWEKVFPAGGKMYAGLVWAFSDINTFGKDGHAERELYADFLDEASLLLDKPGLKEAADQFRSSAGAWDDLSAALLPDEVPLLGETRRLLLLRHSLFTQQGSAALEEIRSLNERLAKIKAQVAAQFPLDQAGVIALRERVSQQLMKIHDIEKVAIESLQASMV